MDIQPIKPLWTTEIAQAGQLDKKQEKESPMFVDIFETMINQVKETDAEKNRKEYALATGQLDNPAEYSFAAAQAAASVELLIQLRNKALDAYNELMRMGL